LNLSQKFSLPAPMTLRALIPGRLCFAGHTNKSLPVKPTHAGHPGAPLGRLGMLLLQSARVAISAFWVLGVWATGAAFAQETTFSTQSSVVIVPALVRDVQGNAVYGLTAKDFSIDDDGMEQAVSLDEAAEAEPVSVVVALQIGRRAEREFSRIRGLSAMLQPIFGQPDAQVALVVFDSKVSLVQDFTHEDGLIEGELKKLEGGDGSAAVLDALDYSVKLLNGVPRGRQRVLLLISETRDHGSQKAKLDEVVTAIGNSNTVVYALPFSPSLSQFLDNARGSNQDEWRTSPDLMAPLAMTLQAMRKNIPRTIASMTGGEYQLFSSRKSFETEMTGFSNHLHSRYLLSFEPKDPHPGLHEIHARLKEPGSAAVLARTSYWVGKTD
jgi:VWFA-related protein